MKKSVGEEVYSFLKSFPTDVLIQVVRAVHPDAKILEIEHNIVLQGKRKEWQIVSGDQRTLYATLSLIGEREAWLNAVQRVCKEKWPMAAREIIQEGV
jgi:hypothetical protein